MLMVVIDIGCVTALSLSSRFDVVCAYGNDGVVGNDGGEVGALVGDGVGGLVVGGTVGGNDGDEVGETIDIQRTLFEIKSEQI